MLTLLLVVILCGVGAWVVLSLNIPQPFKTIAVAILVIIAIVYFFQIVLGVSLAIPVRTR